MKHNYELKSDVVWCISTNKPVASLDADGGLVMYPGMAGPHTAGVRAFLADRERIAAEEAAEMDEEEVNTHRLRDADEAVPTISAPDNDWVLDALQDDDLPPFSKALGAKTPGLPEYIEDNNLTPDQVTSLIRRLEAIHG